MTVCTNSTSLLLDTSSILILYLYLLAIAAYFCFISAMVVNIRVGIRVIASLKRLGLKF